MKRKAIEEEAELLFNAVNNNDVFFIKNFFEKNKDVDIKEIKYWKKRENLLQAVIEDNKIEILQELIMLKVDVNDLGTNYGDTSLHVAANNGNAKMVEMLIQNGADINAKDLIGTPLQAAVRNGHLQVIASLVKYGGEIHIKDKEGKSLLHLAAEYKDESGTAQLLLDLGIDINITDKEGRTALHFAAKRGRDEIVKVLINGKANIHALDKNDMTALHYAAQNGHPAIIEELVNNGADVNSVNKFSYTPLHSAASITYREIYK